MIYLMPAVGRPMRRASNEYRDAIIKVGAYLLRAGRQISPPGDEMLKGAILIRLPSCGASRSNGRLPMKRLASSRLINR